MSKVKSKTNYKLNKVFRFLEMLSSRIFLPYSTYSLVLNFIRFWSQRSKIKKALLSSQDLVDSLDGCGFWLDNKTYALNNIQIINDSIQPMENLHPDMVKRTIISNINDVLESKGKEISSNTTFEMNNITDSVIFIRLAPTWLKAFYISLIDMGICLGVNLIIFLIYLFVY